MTQSKLRHCLEYIYTHRRYRGDINTVNIILCTVNVFLLRPGIIIISCLCNTADIAILRPKKFAMDRLWYSGSLYCFMKTPSLCRHPYIIFVIILSAKRRVYYNETHNDSNISVRELLLDFCIRSIRRLSEAYGKLLDTNEQGYPIYDRKRTKYVPAVVLEVGNTNRLFFSFLNFLPSFYRR